MNERIAEKLKDLPDLPGVYIMHDSAGNIIYIGKAVVLKNRVRQYFNNSPKQAKVQAMVDCVADFEYIITLSEKDALTLEATLIKKHKPKYNILLKDDKANPYIKIDLSVDFPTIEVTRKYKKDGAKYFGPYFNGINVWDVVSVIRSAYNMRTCAKKFLSNGRECLYYHMNMCKAPCCKRISKEQYDKIVNSVMAFLSGREDTAKRLITQKMEASAKAEDFERAITYRNQLDMLTKLSERSIANLGTVNPIDIFSYASSAMHGAVSVGIVRSGKFMGVKNYSIVDVSLSSSDALVSFIAQYYTSQNDVPHEIVVSGEEFNTTALTEFLYAKFGVRVEVTFPLRGVKRKLKDICIKNAEDFLVKSVDRVSRKQEMTVMAVAQLEKILDIPSARRIECYDISNVSGVDKVASQSVFINGEPSKSDYRKYRIKTVEGANDFLSIAEAVRRRFERYKNGDEKFSELPNLIVIDGGKGQLSYASTVLKELNINVPIISLAEREEEIFTLDSSQPIVLSKADNALKLLQRVRDEAHRFAVTYHRTLRSNRYVSQLMKIKGVGEKKCKILLSAFGDYNSLKNATVTELKAVNGIDERTATAVYEYFLSDRKNN